ncbi:hypothetical protein [[Kitasatospora] papulosa]|uniref:hypothetical protein n=1 Tax=[Kitasatospora] papulosa TaxID=1464011 RepID=UPI0036C5D47D
MLKLLPPLEEPTRLKPSAYAPPRRQSSGGGQGPLARRPGVPVAVRDVLGAGERTVHLHLRHHPPVVPGRAVHGPYDHRGAEPRAATGRAAAVPDQGDGGEEHDTGEPQSLCCYRSSSAWPDAARGEKAEAGKAVYGLPLAEHSVFSAPTPRAWSGQ